ncbi:MAG TPA: 4Fe-4S binding protein [Streptosporangiaceae bacterium]|nr:4Fe-4S binding protein [Streptosporangiaceae bacterium]
MVLTAVLVSADDCLGCGACLLTCPEHALRPAPAAPVVLGGRCTGCLECVEVCPADAIHLGGQTLAGRPR